MLKAVKFLDNQVVENQQKKEIEKLNGVAKPYKGLLERLCRFNQSI